MSFADLITDISRVLEQERRIAYRMLKRRYGLDDEDIADLKADLVDAKRIARDEDGRVLVWAQNGVDTTAARAPADRRLLTVMFCDIVDSMVLAERLDVEEWRDVVRLYQTLCAAVIERHAGHIAQYLGDGLLVYFGYPVAQEGEAGRAVRAGLEILRCLHESNGLAAAAGAALNVRIGVHTGPVVVGAMGGAARTEHLALGDTPNIAARVQTAAGVHELLISDTTHRLVEGQFHVDALGARTLKGVSRVMHLYRVIEESTAQSPFDEALATGRLTTFFGRDEELSLMHDHWRLAQRGVGQVIQLSAESGMGKSRIAQEFRARIAHETAQRITIRCSPYHQSSPLYPIIAVCHHVFGFEPAESQAEKRDKVHRALAPFTFSMPDAAELVCDMLSLTTTNDAAVTDAGAARRERLFATLVEWFMQESAQHPVLAIWDDLQWADPSTIALLEAFLDRVPTSATLTILIHRSEFTPTWEQRSFFRQLSLTRLGDELIADLVADVLGTTAAPRPLIDHIREKTDGIPLFVEELSRSILGSDLLDGLALDDTTFTFDPLRVPMTLQDSFEARLDRCASGKEIAQFGALIGREFRDDVLRAVVRDDARVAAGIAELIDADLIYRGGNAASPSFVFKHALLCDTAYDSILLRRRREYHARVAACLEAEFPEIRETQPEVIAHHLTVAESGEAAIEYWYAAALRAGRRSAHAEAMAHLRQAERLVVSTPRSTALAARELDMLLLKGTLVITALGNSAPEVEQTYRRALGVCAELGAACDTTPAYFGLRSFYLTSGELARAHEVSRELHASANASGNDDAMLAADVALATTYYFLGDADAVNRHARAAVARYGAADRGSHAMLYGIDPLVAAHVRLGEVAAWCGSMDAMANHFEHALSAAETLAHPFTQCFAAAQISWTYFSMRDYARSAALCERAAAIAEEYTYRFYTAAMRVARGSLMAMDGGDAPAGVAEIRAALDSIESANTHLMYPLTVAIFAQSLGAAGEVENALLALPAGFRRIEETGARYCEAYLYCVQGDLLTLAHLPTNAGEAYTRAGHIARAQGYLAFELRAALGDARLRGTTATAATLTAIVARCDGHETPDVRDAQQWLHRHA